MNDRELLELAAKAAGLKVHEVCEEHLWIIIPSDIQPDHDQVVMWAPQASAEDALRLAVQLNQEVYQGINDDHAAAFASYVDGQRIRYCIEYHDDYKGDALIATCRAITRAAAETGKSLQEQPQ